MLRLALIVLALVASSPLRGGSIEPFGGDVVPGKVELEYGGILFRPARGGAALKLDFTNLYRVQFTDVVEEFVPGVVLRSGTRVAAPFGPLSDPIIRFPHRNLSIPAAEIAWIVYQRFPAALAAGIALGKTGALLPGGDFFSGTIRGADAAAVKIFNPIFGLRRLEAGDSEVLAAVLRDASSLSAQYEIRAADGSLFGVDNFALERTGVTLRHPLHDQLMLPASEVAEIRAGASRCRPLATLPQLHAEPPDGLQVRDRVMHVATKTVVAGAVPPGFTEFVARVAPGDDLAAGQRIVFAVFADGRLLARSIALAAGDPPQSLRVALEGARGITLRVESAGTATPGGSGRWLQALFLRR